jgi:acetyl-CoA acyltransferase
MTRRAVIASATRTPFTRAHKGELKDTRPDTIAAWAIKEAIAQVPGLEFDQIDDVIMGCAMPEAEQGMNVSRIAAMLAGLPSSVPAMTINRFCSSGVQSIVLAAQSIALGTTDIAVAGGTETMTMIPMGGNKISANPELMETYPEIYTSMGATAEIVAERFEVSREAQDEFAYESQRRAAEAQKAGRLDDEIFTITTTVYGPDGPSEVTLDHDTINRPDTTLEGLAKLRPAFKPNGGTVTAGNASPLTDGAAAAVVMAEEKAEELGVEPLAYYVESHVVGVPPEIMGTGPIPAVRGLLKKTGLSADDIDVFELNEAFAAQSVYCLRELGLDPEKVNPNGGAIALGHPLGVSGTRMTATIIRELQRRGGKRGVVTMCIGGGMGQAVLFEMP